MRSSRALANQGWWVVAMVVCTAGCAQLLNLHDPNGGPPGDDQPPPDGGSNMPGDGSGSGMPVEPCPTAPPVPTYPTTLPFPVTGGVALATAVLDAGATPTIFVATQTDIVLVMLDGNAKPVNSRKLILGQNVAADGLLLADFDNDSLIDVLSWQDGGTQLEIRRRDPGSTGDVFFSSPLVTSLPPGEQIDSVRLADFGGLEGRDLLVGTKSGKSIPVRANQQPMLVLSPIPGIPCGAFDLDGDGAGDFVQDEAGLQAQFFVADEGFEPTPIDVAKECSAAVMKSGGGGPPILLAGSGTSVFAYRQNPPHAFTRQVFFVGLSVTSEADIQVLDIDGDGREDVFSDGTFVLACHSGPLGVAGEANGQQVELAPGAHARLVDLNSDGRPDLISLSAGNVGVTLQK